MYCTTARFHRQGSSCLPAILTSSQPLFTTRLTMHKPNIDSCRLNKISGLDWPICRHCGHWAILCTNMYILPRLNNPSLPVKQSSCVGSDAVSSFHYGIVSLTLHLHQNTVKANIFCANDLGEHTNPVLCNSIYFTFATNNNKIIQVFT